MVVLGVVRYLPIFQKAKWQVGLHVSEAGQQTKMSGFLAQHLPPGGKYQSGSFGVQDQPVLIIHTGESWPCPFPHCGESREGTVPGMPPTHFSCLPAPALALNEYVF